MAYSSGGIETAPAPSVNLEGFHKTGGRFEARIRYSIFNGPYANSLQCTPMITTWPTFWFLPDWNSGHGTYSNAGWPLSGEIDVIDYLYVPDWGTGKTPRDAKLAYGIISGDATGLSKPVNKLATTGIYDYFKETQKVTCNALPRVGPWHDYAVEWVPGQYLKMFKDGVMTLNVVQGEVLLDKEGVNRPIQIPVTSMYPIFELTLPYWATDSDIQNEKNRMEVDYMRYYRFCGLFEKDCVVPEPDPFLKVCPNKGYPSGAGNCVVGYLKAPKLAASVNYWIEKNPSYPGVYYKQISGQCPYGGTFAGPNCLVETLPQLNQNLNYAIVKNYPKPGVYYNRFTNQTCPYGGVYQPALDMCLVKEISNGLDGVVFEGVNYYTVKGYQKPWEVRYQMPPSGKCDFGGTPYANSCIVAHVDGELMDTEMKYWVDTDPRWPGVYYKPNF